MKNITMDQKQMDHLRHINREIMQQKNRLQKLCALQQGRVRQAPGLPSLTPEDAQAGALPAVSGMPDLAAGGLPHGLLR